MTEHANSNAPAANVPGLVMVFMGDHPKAVMLLRAARHRANELGARWCAVYIETPAQASSADESTHERMLRLLTLASQMGGDVVHIEAPTLEEGCKRRLEAEKTRLKLCIIGDIEPERKWRFSQWERVITLASDYCEVEKIPLSGQPFIKSPWRHIHMPDVKLRHMAYALVAVGVAYLCALGLQWAMKPVLFRINSQNVALLFMIACAFVAGRYGLLPGLLASVAGFFTVNYYFTQPYHQIQLMDITDVLNMSLFMLAAILISLFTSQARGYAQRAGRREISTQALFTLYRIAANAFTRAQMLEKLQRRLTRMLDMEVAFFLPPTLSPDRIEPAYPEGLVLSDSDRKAMEICWHEMKTTGLAAPFNPGTQWRFEPMLSPSGEVGVLGVKPHRRNHGLDPWYGQLLTAIADQTAAAIEHIELERSMEATRIREEREKLRSMLLSTVSHDLKTPLAGIIGALSVHNSLGDRLTPQRKAVLLETALEEAHRLNSFITNILDMTRLESGKIEFHSEWHNMESSISQIAKRLQHRLRKHSLTVHPAPADIDVYMDIVMTEQVLQNILDNACKYTEAETPIEIFSSADERGFIVQVRDHGKGIPLDKFKEVFDKYARIHKEDSQVAGTGLGLAICKAIMEAQGGWITAENHPDGGALFTIALPKWRAAVQLPSEKVVA